MIDPAKTAPSLEPSTSQPDCTHIVTDSTPNAPHDDDQWAEIVLASLSKRSSRAKQALLMALLDDEGAVDGSMPLLAPLLLSTSGEGAAAGACQDSLNMKL